MRAVTIADEILSVQDRATPLPESGCVTVAVAGAGLNGADIMQRRGLYPAPPGWPVDVPGLEFAGTIEALGPDVEGFSLGDRVMGIVGGGAQASHVMTDATTLLRVPDSLDLVVAGGFPEAFTTAFDAIVNQGFLLPGERLLVTGAAGGVGTAAIQIGRLLGADVTASIRDLSRREELIVLGANRVVTPDEVKDAGPYDVVIELVGAASLTNGVLAALNEFARVVVIGVGGGAKAEVNLLGIMAGRITLSGSTLRARSREEKAGIAAAMTTVLLPALAEGTLSVPVLARYSLDNVNEAYERFSAGSKLGKIILEV